MNVIAREMAERKLAVALVRAYEGDGTGRPLSLVAAAAAVGLKPKRAAALLRRYKVKPRDKVKRHGGAIPSSLDPRTATSEEEAAERRAALAEVAEGLTVRELAATFGTSIRAVSFLLRAAGIVRRRGRPATVDPEEVKRLRASRFTYEDIGDVLGLSRKGVARVYRDGQSASRRIDPAAVVSLRDEHGYGWDDIGRHLDCHRDTARRLYYRAKRAAPAADQMFAGSVGCSEQNSVMVPSR